jgi:IMP dehydrogenase
MTKKITDIPLTLTFDDVLLQPGASNILPHQVDISSHITKDIKLNTPIISAAMDTVSEKDMAIAMAQSGGMACIHKNLSIEEQSRQIREVKKFESGMVTSPFTLPPTATVTEAVNAMDTHNISSIPITDNNNGKLLGILSHRDVRFVENTEISVSQVMTKDNLITVKAGIAKDEAKRLLHQHRIEKLLVVDNNYQCVGLITVKDIEKSAHHPNACKDLDGRLRVATAVGIGEAGLTRAEKVIEAGADIIIVDTAHGHSIGVIETVKKLRNLYPNQAIIGGNIATHDAASALIDAGANGVKVGIGPGSICTTRIVAGVGVPQLSAIMNVVDVCKKNNVKIIADGGIKFSGDIAKAIAAGADCVMIGSLLAGVEESPGEVIIFQGRAYKTYRGMGSIGAMSRGSADRYFQENSLKLVPEGVEGRVPFKGKLSEMLHQLVGGLRSSMGYTGSHNIQQMQTNSKFVRITNAGLKESHVHDVIITHESPNYYHDE